MRLTGTLMVFAVAIAFPLIFLGVAIILNTTRITAALERRHNKKHAFYQYEIEDLESKEPDDDEYFETSTGDALQ